MRSTRFYLTIAILAASVFGAYWAVSAQEGPRWDPPTVVATDERPAAKKAPILIGAKPFNEKPKAADPAMIIPAAAYEAPRPVKNTQILLIGGTAQALPERKDDESPRLPVLPDLTDAKPMFPAPPAPLPTPTVEPTKVLIAEPPAKKELPPARVEATQVPAVEPPAPKEHVPLPPRRVDAMADVPAKNATPIPPPSMLLPQPDTKQELFPAPKVNLEPKTLVMPSPQNPPSEEPLKSFVRMQPKAAAAAPAPQTIQPSANFAPAPPDVHQPVMPPPIAPVVQPVATPGPANLLTLQTPSITVEKRAGAGQSYQIVVRNLGPVPGRNIRIEDELPSGAKVVSAEPMPAVQGDKAVWVIPELAAPGETILRFTLLTQGNLAPRHHTSVTVSAVSQTHTAAIPVRHDVVNPLTIQILGPLQAAVGKPVVMQIRVGNQSNRPISGIKLYGILPEGLDTPEGRRIEGPEDGMVFPPGESKTLKMPANAVKAGRYVVAVKLATANGLEATDSTPIDIGAETLVVQQAAQMKLLPNRDGDVRIDVTNNTGRALRNVAIVDRLPDGLDFIAASQAGLYQANSRTVYWTIKDLPEGKTQTLYVRVQGAKAGQFQNTVTAKADGVAVQSSTGQIVLEGIADLTLRVVDRESPTYVGREVTYEVQVLNRGSSADRNVRLQVQFPPGMTPKSAKGPMQHSLDKQTVAFEPIASVGPQGQAIFRVSAIAQAAGDQRVQFAIVSEQVHNPIQREISTMVYRD